MKIPQGGIAFFDSGIGGLTVLDTCKKYLPNEIFYYYGDNRRAPYGNLPMDTISAYVEEAFDVFSKLRVKAAVLACNTATAVCVEDLRKKYPFPIIGAEPSVLPAASGGGEVLVLSTCATKNSARFARLTEKALARYPSVSITSVACPTLAEEIEKNIRKKGYSYAHLLPPANPTSVVLGCTHYVYVKTQIEAFYRCPVYDGNEGIAKRLRWALSTSAKSTDTEKNRERKPLVTTARPPQFFYLGSGKYQNKRIFEQMFGK